MKKKLIAVLLVVFMLITSVSGVFASVNLTTEAPNGVIEDEIDNTQDTTENITENPKEENKEETVKPPKEEKGAEQPVEENKEEESDKEEKKDTKYQDDTLIVVYNDKSDANSFEKKAEKEEIKITDTEKIASTYISEVEVPVKEDIEEYIEELEAEPEVEYVQKNFEYKLLQGAVTLNDPDIKKQWHLSSAGASSGSDKGWNYSSGQGIEIAIIDTGIKGNHKDLEGNIKSYKNMSSTSGADKRVDYDGHGTHVAGIIAAKGNNKKQGSGVAYKAKLNIINVFGKNDTVSTKTIANAYEYVIENTNSRVINLSLGYYGSGSSSTDKLFESLIDEAYSRGIVTVCAGGNGINGKAQTKHMYPADFKNTISVVPLTSKNKRASWADYNSSKDIAAPGVSIVATGNNGGLVTKSGSSMASPVVAGTVALMLSENPKLSAEEVKKILASTATDLGSKGKDNYYGYGKVNILKAVRKAGGYSGVRVKVYSPKVAKTVKRKAKRTKITFKLNKKAQATAKVYNKKGKLVKTLIYKKSYKSGTKKLYWNLRTGKGKKVAKGKYHVKFVAKNGKDVSLTIRSKVITVK